MTYQEQYANYLAQLEDTLKAVCDEQLPVDSKVGQAARYSFLAGGKRIRAILTMACCELLQGDMQAATRFACAVEMVHCFSLIHDDLPCMDDDDYRRGKPSCHKAYDEATALLAGDALLNAAFEVIATTSTSDTAKLGAIRALSQGTGLQGMIYGQELDMAFEHGLPTEEDLRKIHRNKTGALINASVQMGLCAGNASEQDKRILQEFAYGIGLVFQIVDDVLDVTSTSEELGKPVGSDAENGKVTFATLYQPEQAMEMARQLNNQVCTALHQAYGQRADFLIQLAELLLSRKH